MSVAPALSSSSSSSSSMAAFAQTSSSSSSSAVSAVATATLKPDIRMGSESLKRKIPSDDNPPIPLRKRIRLTKAEKLEEAEALFEQARRIFNSRDDEAIKLLEQALSLGYIRVEKHLAFACIREKRFSDAAKYHHRILERRESGSSLHNLAIMHHKGDGVDQDDSIAWNYAERAAAVNHPAASVWIATRYEKGAIIKN